MVKQATVILLVIAVLAGVLYYSRLRHEPLKVSGFIEADEVRVGSRVGGRVAKVHVEEGQRVRPGDLLVELEPYDLHERRSEAAATLAARRAELARLEAGFRPQEIAQAEANVARLRAALEKARTGPRRQEIAAAEANLALAIAQKDLAETNLNRIKASFERAAASRDELDQAQDELLAAQAQVTVRQQQLDELKEGTRPEDIAAAEAELREASAALDLMKAGFREEEIAEARAAAEAASAALNAIDRQIEELAIEAPIDGVVEAIELEPGDLVAANAPVLSIVETGDLWVRAYVPENHLDLQVGQHVPISVDSFPGRRFTGHISFIARQAEFTPGNVQTPEERSKQVFRIKVTLDEGLDVLRPGMAADVWLEDVAPPVAATTRRSPTTAEAP